MPVLHVGFTLIVEWRDLISACAKFPSFTFLSFAVLLVFLFFFGGPF